MFNYCADGWVLLPALFMLASVSEANCRYRATPTDLEVRPGYVQFMEPERLNPLKASLPVVEDVQVQELLTSPDTMWYDDESIVFVYQDSVEVVTGVRANCVGRDVGERNSGSVIGKLKNFFGPDYKFRFPFRTVAGADDVSNIKAINFWAPPKENGRTLPVKWWHRSRRQRWNWVFPVGTVFGEVLYQKAGNGNWYVFEIRVRKRYLDGWDVDLFRPFTTATGFADAIVAKRPDWQQNQNLRRVVDHLRDPNNLVPTRMESEAFGELVFEPIDGAVDAIPPISDQQLVIDLLTERPFVSTEGTVWKASGNRETYAPGSQGDFSLVPKDYKMGLIAVNEVSCNRCHEHGGHPLIDFEFDIQLYGEIWGEDRIFTWHLFRNKREIWGTFDDADRSRELNPRLLQAGLLQNSQPSQNDPVYKPLPKPY